VTDTRFSRDPDLFSFGQTKIKGEKIEVKIKDATDISFVPFVRASMAIYFIGLSLLKSPT